VTSPTRLERRLKIDKGPITARRAGRAIALVTLAVTLVSGVAMWLVDRDEFPNVWLGLWWGVQTITTVGYGDITPSSWGGRIIAAIVMISGVAFVTVVTAAITAVFVESARGRLEEQRAGTVTSRLDAIAQRLDRIEARLDGGGQRVPDETPP
jgi:voltage-gated potassium channel Kch